MFGLVVLANVGRMARLRKRAGNCFQVGQMLATRPKSQVLWESEPPFGCFPRQIYYRDALPPSGGLKYLYCGFLNIFVSCVPGLYITMPQQHTFFKQFFFYFFFLMEMVNLGLVYININLITLDHSKN